jgi:hypothetical protein
MLSFARFMNGEPGEKTCALLRESITSFEMLEIFLLMRAEPNLSWTVHSVASRVRMHDDIVSRALESLRAARLVQSSPPLPSGEYRYGPDTPELIAAADELAHDFSERRAAVLSTLSTYAIERLRSGALTAFADAFLLRSRKKDG